MSSKWVLIVFGGALGTLARASLSAFVQRIAGAGFPWGTVAVNLLGCFLFGFVWAVTEQYTRFATELRLALLTGFMGAFTTFSTFAFDTVDLGRAARYAAFGGNLLLQNLGGLTCLVIGLALGRAL